MGTNYYMIRKHSRSAIRDVSEALDRKDYDDARELIDTMQYGIHLGKISAGWKFTINGWKDEADGYYGKSIESFLDFIETMLSTGEYIVKDEYGEESEKYDRKYFSDLIEKNKDGYSSDTYYRDYPSHRDPYTRHDDEIVLDGKARMVFYGEWS